MKALALALVLFSFSVFAGEVLVLDLSPSTFHNPVSYGHGVYSTFAVNKDQGRAWVEVEVVEDVSEAAIPDRIGQLLQTIGRTVDDGTDVGTLVEGVGGFAQGGREIRHRLRHVILATPDVIGCLLAGRFDEETPTLDGRACHLADVTLEEEGPPVG